MLYAEPAGGRATVVRHGTPTLEQQTTTSLGDTGLNIEPVSGALGAEIHGLRIDRELSNRESEQLHAAFLDHKVLFFRDQQLSPQQQLGFARLFGEPEVYPFIKGLDDAPEIIEILKTETDKKNFGGSWHSDTSYMPEPALGTVLYGLEIPDAGGDTLFANTALAYEALSDGMRDLLDGLHAVNSSEHGYAGGRAAAMSRLDAMGQTYKTEATVYESVHPVVRTHPQTGARSLYLNRSHTRQFEGMSVEESRPLIEYLCAHMVRPEFTCRFRWRPGSVAVWDNRTTLHYALDDYPGKRRRMRRITLKGERPR